jgi:hypothetical protein
LARIRFALAKSEMFKMFHSSFGRWGGINIQVLGVKGDKID